ncbi:uncharacterized protein EI97DRAFT_371162 [Westerdykella ornata]|uniref:BZIP domain-containing protein n=1 Tax=Westerdykella ornata TaxID=318751 RepID=A0A6A6JTF4_WESOR|nr:uncharacterized protein EI97DRAFT_371162 [Westerdykella ornata]KAF2279393.1 hypothetical protein EI97DRAFT_371162 [Westerdykella ornata]
MSPTQPGPGTPSFPGNSPHHASAPQGVSLPPLRHLSQTPPMPQSDRRQGNPLGVHSMLNPQAELAEQQRSRRRSGSQMESPSPVETLLSNSLPSISRPPSVGSAPDDARAFPPPGRPPVRHMLSPRSPGVRPPQPVGMLGQPTGTIDAIHSPFVPPSNRGYGLDPLPSQTSAPTLPLGPRTTYFSPMPPTAPTPPPSVPRNEMRRPSLSFPQSGTASPIPSYSPFNSAASVASSPSQFETASQQGVYGSRPPNPPIAMETERAGLISMQPSGQNTIQMMTIKNQHGHDVQIPVDVQAASKVADEKRKRNAGASARFRARRKEKEREASDRISRLEQELAEAREDADFYRSERDFFKAAVLERGPAEHHHYARPPSPRLRRPSAAPSSTAGGSVSSFSGYDDAEPLGDGDRNVRRRTSSYHPASGPPPPHTNGSGPHPNPDAGPPPPPPPASTQPPQAFDPRTQRPLPDLQLPPAHRPVLRDPFAHDAGRYEGGNWGHGSNRG